MLAAREDELRKIRDGVIVVRQKFRSTTNTKREAFDNYMNKFIRRSSIQVCHPRWLYKLCHLFAKRVLFFQSS